MRELKTGREAVFVDPVVDTPTVFKVPLLKCFLCTVDKLGLP